jgi:hypothetical protein
MKTRTSQKRALKTINAPLKVTHRNNPKARRKETKNSVALILINPYFLRSYDILTSLNFYLHYFITPLSL